MNGMERNRIEQNRVIEEIRIEYADLNQLSKLGSEKIKQLRSPLPSHILQLSYHYLASIQIRKNQQIEEHLFSFYDFCKSCY